MKTVYKLALFIGLIIIGGFSFSKNTQARVIDIQPVATVMANTSNVTGWYQTIRPGVTGIPIELKFYGRASNGLDQMLRIEIRDLTAATSTISSGTFSFYSLPDHGVTAQTVTVPLTGTTPFDKTHLYDIHIQSNGNGGNTFFALENIYLYGTTANYSGCLKGVPGSNYTEASRSPCDNNAVALAYSVATSGQLKMFFPAVNSIGPDFQNWIVELKNIWPNSTSTPLIIKIDTGVTGIDTSQNLNNPSNWFETTATSTNVDTYLTVKKSQELLNGHYGVRATLYTQSGTTLIVGEITYFEITTGSATSTNGGWYYQNSPNNPYSSTTPASNLTQTCGPTDFSLNFGFGSVDFGQGLCNTLVFLFYPPEYIVGVYQGIYNSLTQKIPFSYFYEIQSIISSSTTGTYTSIPTINIQTSATSSIPNLNIAIFSSSSLAQLSTTYGTGFGYLRTMANILLYAGFGLMCYWTAVGLIKKD